MKRPGALFLTFFTLSFSACLLEPAAAPLGDAGQDAQTPTPLVAPQPEVPSRAQPLAAVSVVPAVTEAVRCSPRTVCLPPVKTALEACKAAIKVRAAEDAFYYRVPGCKLVRAEAHAGRGAIRGAALLALDEVEWTTSYLVALAGPDGYDRIVSFMDLPVGMNETVDLAFTTFALQDLVPGGALELRVEMKRKGDNHDCSGEQSVTFRQADVGVCGVDSVGKAYCLPMVPRSYREVETIYDPETGKESKRITGYNLRVRIEQGNLIVEPKLGDIPEALAPLLGSHSLLDPSWHPADE